MILLWWIIANGTNVSKIWIKVNNFLFIKIQMKTSAAKWRPLDWLEMSLFKCATVWQLICCYHLFGAVIVVTMSMGVALNTVGGGRYPIRRRHSEMSCNEGTAGYIGVSLCSLTDSTSAKLPLNCRAAKNHTYIFEKFAVSPDITLQRLIKYIKCPTICTALLWSVLFSSS